MISKSIIDRYFSDKVSNAMSEMSAITNEEEALALLKQRYGHTAYNNDYAFSVVGLGGVGSFLLPLLVKIGRICKLKDIGSVSHDNVLAQNYSIMQAHQKKTDASFELISNLNGVIGISEYENVIIYAVDNMKSRYEYLEYFVRNSKAVLREEFKKQMNLKFIVDLRMSPGVYEIFIIPQTAVVDYVKRFMFESWEASPTPCGTALKPQLAYVGAGVLCEEMLSSLKDLASDDDRLFNEAIKGKHISIYGSSFLIQRETIIP